MSLPPEVRSRYSAIIDSILAEADLSTISDKRVRKILQEQVEYDITPQKNEIKALIGERFDLFTAKQDVTLEPVQSVETPELSAHRNGVHHSSKSSEPPRPAKRGSDDEASEIEEDIRPKKKQKHHAGADADAALAAKLQAEEDKRARSTRNGTVKKRDVKKAPKKKRTAKKVTGSDDSDVDSDAPARKVNRNTGFHKPLNLSPSLSALFGGETTMSRPQVTKRIWEYIKGNDLQDPSDKRYILCDEALQGLFKQDKVQMFTMTKLLNQHMFAQDD